MGAPTTRFRQLVNKYTNQGMSDNEAVAKAMEEANKETVEANKREKERTKKPGWIENLKMGATKHIKEKYHSPSGRKYLQKQKTGKGRGY